MPYPSMAVLCEPARKVYCTADERSEVCLDVKRAIEEIDAVVPGLLVYGGTIDWDYARILRDSNQHVTVTGNFTRADMYEQAAPGRSPKQQAALASQLANILGMTVVQPADGSVCIPFVPILFVFNAGELTPADQYQVIIHEMMHSIGAGHAETNLPWQTVMRPGLASEHRAGLSIVDRQWLRAVYGR